MELRSRKERADIKNKFLLGQQVLVLFRGYRVKEFLTQIVLEHPSKDTVILSHAAAQFLIKKR